jgi:HEAT repeat protein
MFFQNKMFRFLGYVLAAAALLFTAACAGEESNWEKARQKNTAAAYRTFLEKYPDSRWKEEAKTILAWEEVKLKDTPGAYKKFEKSDHFQGLRYVLQKNGLEYNFDERYAWAEARHLNTIEAYKDFLSYHPRSKFAGTAKKRMKQVQEETRKKMENQWQEALTSNTYESYSRFISTFPTSAYVLEAHRRVMPLAEQKWLSLLKKTKRVKQAGRHSLKNIPGDVNIIFVPLKKHILFIQELVYPGRLKEYFEKPLVYVLYDYKRGKSLGYAPSGVFAVTRSTQEVIVTVKVLYSDLDKNIFLLGEFSARGGSGAKSRKNLVDTAVYTLNVHDKFKKPIHPIILFSTGNYIKYPKTIYPQQIIDEIMINVLKTSPYWSDISLAASQLKNSARKVETLSSLITGNKENSIRTTAMKILGNTGDERGVALLIHALKDKNRDVRKEAAVALGQVKDKKAVEPLVQALKDNDGEVRRKAAEALGIIRDIRSVVPLIESLKDEHWPVRKEAAIALGKIRDKRAVEPLIRNLEDEEPNVRSQTAKALGKIRDKRAEESLIRALGDIKSRNNAIIALGELKSKKAVEPLILTLKDQNNYVRILAVEALRRIRDIRSVEPLIETLKDKDRLLRIKVIEALERIGDKRAIEPLIHTMQDENVTVKVKADKALKKITGEIYSKDYEAWQKWWKKNK